MLMSTEMISLPGTIGPYRVTGRLGRGGMGEVLRGHDDRLDRPVALKRILPDLREPQAALQRFRREARAVARLNHPSIVQVYDWEEQDAQHWLIMEFVEGRSLNELIAEGPLPPERALEIARDAASGLAEAHEVGLVHRDLKTTNVIVSTRGRAKILDFGLAKTIRLEDSGKDRTTLPSTTLTGEGRIVGTVTAMSPEQAMGRKVDHRSDLFSLGILLYEMLSGVLPFKAESAIETLTRICSAQEEPLRDLDPTIPEGVAKLVTHLLEKDPARRPPDARQVVAQIDRLRSGSRETDAVEIATDQETRLSLEATRVERSVGAVEEEPEGVASADAVDLEKKARVVERGNPLFRQRSWLNAAAAILIGLGLWSLKPWTEDEPAIGATASTPLPAPELTTHELYQRGMTLLERFDREGNIGKAIDDFQRALALDEGYAPAMAGLAHAYWYDYRLGGWDPQRLQQALAIAEQAVVAGEHFAFAHVSLGIVYTEMGRFDDAVRVLEHALTIEPLNAAAWGGLGNAARSQADHSRAEECYLKAINAQPANWLWHSFLGSLYYSTERYGEAEEAFLRQLELAPDSFNGFSNLGGVYHMQGRLGEAATQYQKALEIRKDSKTYSNLGTLYFAQGFYVRSVSAFKKSLNTGGSNHYQNWANLGDAFRWTPDNQEEARQAYVRALQLLDEKLALTPKDTNLRTSIPMYKAKLGNCDQALAHLASIGNLPMDDGTAWFQIAVTNEICERRDDALTNLQTALTAGYPLSEIQGNPELLELRQDVRYHRLTTVPISF